MNVIAFRHRPLLAAWSETELQTLTATLCNRGDQGWETGLTETGDAQFYLLGPQPEQACVLCVSRIGGRYILEDGKGRLLFEHRSLPLVVAHARHAMPGVRWSMMARIVMVWCTIRHMVHDKLEPMMLEGEELLAHFAPQLAAFV